MRTSLLLALLVLVACAKSSPATTNREAILAQPSYDRSANDVPGESPDTVRQLEALIERDLYAMGLPSQQSYDFSLSGNGIANNVENTKELNATRPAVQDDKAPQDAVPPSPQNAPSKIEAGMAKPTATAPKDRKEKTKSEEKGYEDSCQKTCSLIDNICDAAERICQITEKLPKDSDAPQRCERARNACTRAQSQGASCPCSS